MCGYTSHIVDITYVSIAATIATKIYTIATYFSVSIVRFYVAHVLPLLWKFCVTYVKILCPICAVLCHFCDAIPA